MPAGEEKHKIKSSNHKLIEARNSPGPSMMAWISVRSSSLASNLIPSGGCLTSSANSFEIFLMTFGAKFSTLEVYTKYKQPKCKSLNSKFHHQILTAMMMSEYQNRLAEFENSSIQVRWKQILLLLALLILANLINKESKKARLNHVFPK